MILTLPLLAVLLGRTSNAAGVCLAEALADNSCECQLYACEANSKLQMQMLGGGSAELSVVLLNRGDDQRAMVATAMTATFPEVVAVMNTFPDADYAAENLSLVFKDSALGVDIPVFDDASLRAAIALAAISAEAGDTRVQLFAPEEGESGECNTPSYEFNPSEQSREYSSIWDSDPIGTRHARSTLDSPQAWSAQTNQVGEYVQIDLGYNHQVVGVISQRRNGSSQRVTSYTVSYANNKFGTFTEIDQVFEANVENNDVRVTNVFEDLGVENFEARFVRIIVKTWESHVSMRVGLLVKDCIEFECLGSPEVMNPDENERSYSSVWDNDPVGTRHARSMLDGPQAWSARTNAAGQWMMIDLRKEMLVTGVVTQSRLNSNQMVTSYKISFAQDKWQDFAMLDEVFDGNSEQNTKVQNDFEVPFRARYVRFVVQTWNSHASMRAAVVAIDC